MKGLSLRPSSNTATCNSVCTIRPSDKKSDFQMESIFVDKSDVNHVDYRVVTKTTNNRVKWTAMDSFYRRYRELKGELEIRFRLANVTKSTRLWILFEDRVSIRCCGAKKQSTCQPPVPESTTRTTATTVPGITPGALTPVTQSTLFPFNNLTLTQTLLPATSTLHLHTVETEEEKPDDIVIGVVSALAGVAALGCGIALLMFCYRRHRKVRRAADETVRNTPETSLQRTEARSLPAAPGNEKIRNDYEEVEPENCDVMVDESVTGGRVSGRCRHDYEEAEGACTPLDTGGGNVAGWDDFKGRSTMGGYVNTTPASAFGDDGLYRQLAWRQTGEGPRETEAVYNHTRNQQSTGASPTDSGGVPTQSADDMYHLLLRDRREVIIDNVYGTTKP